jgi:hypothetical protein
MCDLREGKRLIVCAGVEGREHGEGPPLGNELGRIERRVGQVGFNGRQLANERQHPGARGATFLASMNLRPTWAQRNTRAREAGPSAPGFVAVWEAA